MARFGHALSSRTFPSTYVYRGQNVPAMHLGARGVMKNEVVDSGRVRGVWGVLERVFGLEELVHVAFVEVAYELCGVKVNEM